MDQYFNVQQKNIQYLFIKLFKAKTNILTYRMNTIFHMRDNLRYNLRSKTEFQRSSVSAR